MSPDSTCARRSGRRGATGHESAPADRSTDGGLGDGTVSGYEADGLAAGLPESDGLGLAGADGLELEPASVGALLGAACDGAACDGAAVGAETGDGVGVALGPQAAMDAVMAMIARSRLIVDLLL